MSECEPGLRIEASSDDADRRTTLVLSGTVEMGTAQDLVRACEDAIAQGATTLVLDVSGVDYMDSSGLNTLVRAHRMASGDVVVVVHRPSENVRQVLRMTALDTVLRIETE